MSTVRCVAYAQECVLVSLHDLSLLAMARNDRLVTIIHVLLSQEVSMHSETY